jgi:hypothetical protein
VRPASDRGWLSGWLAFMLLFFGGADVSVRHELQESPQVATVGPIAPPTAGDVYLVLSSEFQGYVAT